MESYKECFGKGMAGNELFVGIDVHKTTWHITAVDRAQNKITSFSQPTGSDALITRFNKARPEGLHVHCVYEAGYFGHSLF